jgi:hypothetical protein
VSNNAECLLNPNIRVLNKHLRHTPDSISLPINSDFCFTLKFVLLLFFVRGALIKKTSVPQNKPNTTQV